MKNRARTIRPKPAATPRPKPLPDDVALLSGPTEDGEGARVLRFKGGTVYAGEVRPMREGQPLHPEHELVRLRPLHARVPLCEVEVLHASSAQAQRSGPARVATDRYRRNWGTVFGTAPKATANKKKRSDLN